MIRSLALKLAMLAITMGVVFWITWQPVKPQQNDSGLPDTPSLAASLSVDVGQHRTNPVVQSVDAPIGAALKTSNHVGVGDHTGPRLVDLNSASVDELEALPGIGAVLAQRVIAYRKSVGRFLAVEDLREVKGIGAKTFDRIKPLVTVARGEQKGKTEKRPS